jgi:membrane protein
MNRRSILKPIAISLWSSCKPLKGLALGVWSEVRKDNLPGLAAEVSFFFCLALFPFFILLAAVAGILPSTELWNHILPWVTRYLPQSSQMFVFETVAGLTHGGEKFLSIGVVSAAWATAGGVLTLISSLNAVYGVPETRSIWKRALIIVFMLFVICFLFLGSFGLLTVGHFLAVRVMAHTTLGGVLNVLWEVLHWVVSLLLLTIGMGIIYAVLPDHKHSWHWITPGTVLVILTWIPGSLAFNFYIRHNTSYSKIYGTMEAFMVLMVWIYIISLIVLIGAEVNCEFMKRHSTGRGAPMAKAS